MSSRGQRLVSRPAPLTEAATLSPAGSPGWTDSLTTAQSTTPSVADLPAVTQGLERITTQTFPSETSSDKSNKVTKHSFHSSADKIHGVSESFITSSSTNIIKTATRTSAYTSVYTPYHGHDLFNLLYGPIQIQHPGMDPVSANNPEIRTSFPSSQDSQAVQRLQVASTTLTSALQSAHLKGYSVSSHVTNQTLNQTAYTEKEDKTAVDSQAYVHKITGDTIMSPLTSRVVNPAVSPAITLRPTGSFITVSSETPPGKTSFFESAITKLTPIHSGMVSSEHASNPGDLLMAAGHSSPRVPAINMNYNQGVIAGAELKPISTQAHQNNSLSLTWSRPEFTTFSILGLITRSETASSTSDSDLTYFPSNKVINIQDFETQTRSPNGTTQQPTVFSSNIKTVYLSGSALPVRLANDMTYKTSPFSTDLVPSFVSHSPNYNIDDNTGISANSEVHFADQSKALSSQITPSTRSFQTRSLLMLSHIFNTTSPNKSQQTVSSAGVSAYIINSERAGHSIYSSFDAETSAGNEKTLPFSSVHVSYEKRPTGSFHINPAKSSVSASFDGNEETTLIRDTVFYNKGAPSGQLTTQVPFFITTKDVFTLNKRSEGSPSETPFSPVSFDVALEPLKSRSPEHDVTLMGLYEQSSPSSWSEIISTPRANSTSSSQGPITSVSSDKSKFYLGRQTTSHFTASSAAATSSSDRQNSTGTLSAIFSFGTKLMAPYTKWKATRPVPFQSSASESENTSTGFDRANSNLAADGPSYEHPKLVNEQEHNVHILNSTDPTAVASDPHSVHPTVGELPSFTYVKGTSKSEEQGLNLSPANHRSAVAVQRGATVNNAAPSAWGSEGFLPLSHVSTDSVTSSQGTSIALVYNSNPSLADDAAVTLSNSPAHSFSASTTASRVKGLTSSPLTFSSSSLLSSSSKPLSLSLSGTKAYQVTSPVSSEAANTSKYPGTASFSVKPVPPTFSSLSPSLNSSTDSDRSQQVTDTFVVLTEAGTDELNAGTSRAVALTFPKEKEASLVPSELGRITLSAGPTERTSQVPPLSPRQDTTTASVKLTTTTVDSTTKTTNPTTNMPSLSVTTGSTQSTTTTTPQPAPVTRRTTTTTTIRTQTSRRTFTPPVPRTSPPRGAITNFISPFTTTTEVPPQQCNITERMWVKTGTVNNAFAAVLKKIK